MESAPQANNNEGYNFGFEDDNNDNEGFNVDENNQIELIQIKEKTLDLILKLQEIKNYINEFVNFIFIFISYIYFLLY